MNFFEDEYSYENSCSLNQNLNFKYAEKIFADNNVSFDKNNIKSLGIINSEEIYTGIGLLLADECPNIIKIKYFSNNEPALNNKLEFSGSILKQLDDSYRYLEYFNNAHQTINSSYYKEKNNYPAIALREGLLNAAVHKDYSNPSEILIKIFNDHINILNSCSLNKDISIDDIMIGFSSLINPKLANIFCHINLIDSYGTGITKIMQSYSKQQIKPKFEVTNRLFSLTLPNRNSKNGIGYHTDENDNLIKYIEDNDIVSRYDLQAKEKNTRYKIKS